MPRPCEPSRCQQQQQARSSHARLCPRLSNFHFQKLNTATLLPGGRTVHSRFKLPVPLFEHSTSSLTPSRHKYDAAVLRDASLILWDEAPMAPSHALTYRRLSAARADVRRPAVRWQDDRVRRQLSSGVATCATRLTHRVGSHVHQTQRPLAMYPSAQADS